MHIRNGDSVVIDPATRKVMSVNGEPCTEMTPELEALVNEHLGQIDTGQPGRVPRPMKLAANDPDKVAI